MNEYVYQEFPRILHHPTLGQVTVKGEMECNVLLQKGWTKDPNFRNDIALAEDRLKLAEEELEAAQENLKRVKENLSAEFEHHAIAEPGEILEEPKQEAEKIICEECGKTFDTKNQLRGHMISHSRSI